ncbi:MAG: preprotein translocase subunit SecY [Deltaproteobacteria bacterium]|nr:preprotein translocase subunit SecY [Deltaproteobacteria bacterium]MBW2016228.1 preprotein translocase subunit SecY [Deltaproteobacteria bacterium]MBW2130048.1 preprotein translocase subunit SecY [Deltaproteobacteria bacterium]MBW2304304.1 preprotein translocase subunit SecY [Deltaproteobacteria bacterium]
MIHGVQNIAKIPELKKRILFTLVMLAVYRLGCHIPTPGIDGAALSAFFSERQGTLFGLFDMFSGGALRRMSVMALGIMPYISASIILELLTVVIPYLEKLKKEGEQGRKKITQYTRYGTVLLSMIQGFGIAIGLERMSSPGGIMVVPVGGWGFRILAVITLTAGTAFLMWLGEQITERGIGNGISLIIFAGIVARFPSAVLNSWRLMSSGEMSPFFMAIIVAMMIGVVGFIVFVERAQRRIPVQYAKRVVGRKMYGGQSTHLPLKINTAGVIPPIFASSIIMFPATIANFLNVKETPWLQMVVNLLSPGHAVYILIYVIFIVFFCYFYTAVHFNPVDVADNMKKYGGFIPGIRPGKNTAEYIDRVLTRITFSGAIYVSAVCILPQILIYKLNVPFYFGGTALLIVVGVAMDTSNQIESHMLTRHYEGFMRKGFGRVR